MAERPSLALQHKGEAEGGGSLKLVFRGVGGVKHLLGRKQQGSASRQGSEQDAGSPSQAEPGGLSDSPGRPSSPSSAEPSPAMAPPGGPRSVHGQPPGKQPYPHDTTPEAEAVRAGMQPPGGPAGGGGGGAAGAAGGAAGAAGEGPAAAAGPRSVHGQPPGKQPHPDDPAFAAQAPGGPQPAPDSAAGLEGAAAAGPRSVHGQPPGKQPHQLVLIQADAGVDEEQDASQPAGAYRHPQHQLVGGPAVAEQGWAGGEAGRPSGSSGGMRQHSAPPPGAEAASRKRPASQLGAGDGAPRSKRPSNGAAAAESPAGGGLQRLPTGMSAAQSYSAGVPASLARAGSMPGRESPAPLARPMPGAPRSLQQRQQLLMNGGGGAAAAVRQPAGAPRARTPSAAPKPKPPAARAPSSGQRKSSSSAGGGGGGAPGGAPQYAFQYGDVVWAKIGVYPWWPAQLQRPTAEEHFRPKHAATDMFCVFYGSNDYNWLPPSALKPFNEAHPDYLRHASVKNKALQKAIDEAWVYGVQRERPDGPKYAYGGGAPAYA